jgi:uncharacterized protein (TIGR00251 family)
MSGGSTTKGHDPARPGAPGGARDAGRAPLGPAPGRDVNGENKTNNEAPLTVRQDADGVVIAVRAKPRASRSRVVGVTEGALDVAVAAPPVDGAANDELVRTLAAHFGIPRRRVTLLAGEGSRHKRVHLAGFTAADVLERVKAAS